MKYLYNKWWFQLALWGGIFIFFLLLMSQFKDMRFTIFAASYATINMYLVNLTSKKGLIPLHQKGHPHAILITGITITLLGFLSGTLEHYIVEHHFLDNNDHPPIVFFYVRQIFTFGFIFSVNYVTYLLEQTSALKIQQKQLREEKLSTELQLLKAQINPHFIFNALNNIYSLSYMQSAKAPESVLKLSEMLRYVFYDCSKDKVNINSEIKYIKNFTAFQQMKSEENQNIKLTIQLNNSSTEVAPMLFIPFIENAFKYSRIEEDKEAFVKIDITQKKDTLNFYICNNIPTENRPLSGSGMGIENVQHRLDIIYPNKYQLNIKAEENQHTVQLALKI